MRRACSSGFAVRAANHRRRPKRVPRSVGDVDGVDFEPVITIHQFRIQNLDDAIVAAQDIDATSIDPFGSAETNDAGDSVDVLPIYTALTANGPVPIMINRIDLVVGLFIRDSEDVEVPVFAYGAARNSDFGYA